MKALLILLLALPVMAEAPNYLQGRDVAITCKGGVCTISESDMEFIVGRDAAMLQTMQDLAANLKNCRWRGA